MILLKSLMEHIMAKSKNKNIVPLKNIDDLINECNYSDFEYKTYFDLICKLIPNIEKEKLEIEIMDEQKCAENGFVYVLVIEGKIFKIGQSINNIKSRIQSYNCGKTEYRINGTNSTTNYFVLQSLLKINKEVFVYAFFPPKPHYEIFGQHFEDSHPPSKKAENIIIKKFIEKHGKKPIGCTQQ